MVSIVNSLILTGAALLVLITMAAYSVYFERKVSAVIQQRSGPNRVGPLGLLQPLADVLKLLLKEDIIPTSADKLIHYLAPVIAVTISIVTIAVIPFSGANPLTPEMGDALVIANVDIGVLYILAVTSIAVYGITLAGWSSNSKYSLLGGLRSSAQMISYELAMGLSVVGIILLTNITAGMENGSLRPENIVEAQRNVWNVFINPIGFLIFVTCAFAEANRAPFDLVEAEQELVGGFHTEYSSMKFALFFLAEYIHIIMSSAVISTLFLGGYLGPFEGAIGVANWPEWVQMLWGLGWFLGKTIFFIFVFMWVRWTLPRFKYNQLMDIGWKQLLPISLINLVLIAVGSAIYVAWKYQVAL
jgi:NADH-quinone oxidoreductase subunit H